jgi:hypothetical protein
MTTTASSAVRQSRTRRPWTPTDVDHEIFQWVKCEGFSQAWTASQHGLSQATVSRIVQRYERWQAHAAAREGGRLDHAERLRTQRWLTFERNELILAHCLRIAGQVEGFADRQNSVTSYPQGQPGREAMVRRESACIDRTGMVARFLRLAFRINMEQLKLAESDEPPPASPLSDEELAAEAAADAAVAADLAERQRRRQEREEDWMKEDDHAKDNAHPVGTPAGRADATTHDSPASTSPLPASASTHTLHNLHNGEGRGTAATPCGPSTCAPKPRPRKKSSAACITNRDNPRGSSNGKPKRATTAPDETVPRLAEIPLPSTGERRA